MSDYGSDTLPSTTNRTQPNILVTGTPGTGKTTTCEMIADATSLQHIDVSRLVKEKGLHEGYNEEFDTFILDDEKLCDELEDVMEEGGKIVDFHSCEVFPERWFDLVIVLRADNGVLYGRLEQRQSLCAIHCSRDHIVRTALTPDFPTLPNYNASRQQLRAKEDHGEHRVRDHAGGSRGGA
ncbi:P-loop containing nucleoside triphosphate hydrolase protein [Jimgerdemannia flammicorona]|uniref:P-loop containing nucleoside triphosphate hydrolase protein n=1 Tax=Jimgerdemannia flammicorona TaxID=994334 RepID=A0A433D358_9FUNG|nr:P-loop containing nucleoside triphosphate hydrolase protein [Jimgerdemannia flammicorona]